MPGRSLIIFPLYSVLFPALAFGQFTFSESRVITAAQNALPSQGPAAARFNPAALADVHLASGAIGNTGWTNWRDRQSFGQLAVEWPRQSSPLPFDIAFGFGYFGGFEALAGTNPLNNEGEYVPGIAVAYPADPAARYRVAAGMAFTITDYNAFNAVRSQADGVDMGIIASYTGWYGRFGLGYANHHLRSPRISQPGENPDYRVPMWSEPSADWASAKRLVSAHMGLYFNESHDSLEGPQDGGSWGMNGWDVEIRPYSCIGLKLERTRYAPLSTLGIVLYPPPSRDPYNLRLEIDFGHSLYLPPALPFPIGHFLFGSGHLSDGIKTLLGISLSAGI